MAFLAASPSGLSCHTTQSGFLKTFIRQKTFPVDEPTENDDSSMNQPFLRIFPHQRRGCPECAGILGFLLRLGVLRLKPPSRLGSTETTCYALVNWGQVALRRIGGGRCGGCGCPCRCVRSASRLRLRPRRRCPRGHRPQGRPPQGLREPRPLPRTTRGTV